MTNCSPPAPPANPFAGMSKNPCLALDALKDAQLQLLAGGVVARVSFQGQEVSFSRANATELRLVISRLSAECDAAQGRKRTVRIGPDFRWSRPFNGYGC